MNSGRAPPPYGGKLTIALFGKQQHFQKTIEDQILCGDHPHLIESNNVVMHENNSFKVINSCSFFDEHYAHPDQHIIDFMALCHPGPDLFILAISSADIQEEELMTQLRKLQDTFGESILSHLVVMLADGKSFNSLCHLQEQNLKLVMLTDIVASDCKRWCHGRHSFIFDYDNYSHNVVTKRKTVLGKKRTDVHQHNGRAGDLSTSLSSHAPPAPEKDTNGHQSGNIAHEVSDNTLNIVLLGLTGTGKSASANTILSAGKSQLDPNQLFKSESSSLPVTTRCEVKTVGKLYGTQVRVVDTPDFLHDELQNCKAHVEECKRYLQPGQCVVLLVLQLSRFTDSEVGLLERLEDKLGCRFRDVTIVLLTHGEDLKGDLRDFVKSRTPLQNIVEQCGWRCHRFNNNSKDTKQVRKLIKKFPNWQTVFPQLKPSTLEVCGVS